VAHGKTGQRETLRYNDWTHLDLDAIPKKPPAEKGAISEIAAL
jgi:hypothetical protein